MAAESDMTIQVSSLARLRSRLADIPVLVGLLTFAFLFVLFSITAENFLTLVSLTNILTIASIKGIFVIGVAMLMISGELDLSVGSILAVAAFVFAITLESGMSPLLAFTLALVISGILGLINGQIVTRTGIPSFIATLGTLLAYRGIARGIGGADFARFTGERPFLFSVLNGDIDFINELAFPAGNARIGIIWFALFTLIAAVVMARSRYGSLGLRNRRQPGGGAVPGSANKPRNRYQLCDYRVAGGIRGSRGSCLSSGS